MFSSQGSRFHLLNDQLKIKTWGKPSPSRYAAIWARGGGMCDQPPRVLGSKSGTLLLGSTGHKFLSLA